MTNTRKHDFSLLDPGLTEKGKLQCRELAEFLKHDELAQKIELIVASPLKRTLETTDIALEWLIKDKGIPVVLKPEWQETTDKPCDTGRPVLDVKAEWPQFDFSTVLMDPHYPHKEGPYAYTQDALMERIRNCLKWLHHRDEKVICVVSHSGFLRRLSYRKYGNADFRIFDFASRDNSIEERDTGHKGKGGRGLSPDDPSRPKEHWAGIKKSSSISHLAGITHLKVPEVPERPNSR